MKKLILPFVFMVVAVSFAEVTIPPMDPIEAYIHLSFKTTVTVEKTPNPDCYAASFSFAMGDQLYSSLDGAWDATHCNLSSSQRDCDQCKKETELETFDLNELKISVPKFDTTQNTTFSMKLCYKEHLTDTMITILNATNISTADLISGGYSMTQTPAFSTLSHLIEDDILMQKCDSRDSTGKKSVRRFDVINFTLIFKNTGARLPQTTPFQRFDVEVELKPEATMHTSI